MLYHASIGMGKFYIYDTQSDPPMEPVLDDLIASGLVEYHYVTNTTEGIPKKALYPMGNEAKRERGASLNWQRAIYPLCTRQFGPRHKWMGEPGLACVMLCLCVRERREREKRERVLLLMAGPVGGWWV